MEEVYAVWVLHVSFLLPLPASLTQSASHIPPPPFPVWPAVNSSLPSSLKDYSEGHPLRSAIRTRGRETALIGPEIAKETRLDLEGGQGKVEWGVGEA